MKQGIYRIEIKGQLDKSRSEWFEGRNIAQGEDGTTVIIQNDKFKRTTCLGWIRYLLKFGSLILKLVWTIIKYTLVMHSSPDYHWQAGRVAKVSKPIISHYHHQLPIAFQLRL